MSLGYLWVIHIEISLSCRAKEGEGTVLPDAVDLKQTDSIHYSAQDYLKNDDQHGARVA